MDKIIEQVKKIIPAGFLVFFQPLYHFLLAYLAVIWYRFPSRQIKVIGVTGTKGKTTTVEMIYQIFSAAGIKTAALSSLSFKLAEEEKQNMFKMTMPGRFFVQKFLREAVKKECRVAVLEITSEGIKQFRHRGINFQIAVITGVHPEHIESHGSFEKYLRAKLDLFWRLKKNAVAVINLDDDNHHRFEAATQAKKCLYSHEKISFNGNSWKISKINQENNGVALFIDDQKIEFKMVGVFNAVNVLAASAVALIQNVSLNQVALGISRVYVPGRMEFIKTEPINVVVDYAHTPDSLRQVYSSLLSLKGLSKNNTNLICVLGAAGGGRDKWKRPLFGNIAEENCKKIFITNEDPYDEDPETIMREVAAGLSKNFSQDKYKLVLDRKIAVKEAIESASGGDTVIVTGKGAEPWLVVAQGVKIPWDDREVVREALAELHNNK